MTQTPTHETALSPIHCELWLRTNRNPGAPHESGLAAFQFDRLWWPGEFGSGDGTLITPFPPALHDHLELPPGVTLHTDARVRPLGALVVVGRSWRFDHEYRPPVLAIALAHVAGRLIYHHPEPDRPTTEDIDN